MAKLPDEQLETSLRFQTKYIAIVIRNAMEDFHCEHLTDAQMKELNPIIRNAVFTALYSMFCLQDSSKARAYIDYHLTMIPSYWEEPELLKGFKV